MTSADKLRAFREESFDLALILWLNTSNGHPFRGGMLSGRVVGEAP
jgi:hypothetical protein